MNAILKIKYEDCDQSFDNHGWFNATEAAKRFKRRANDWINLSETQRYIEALLKREVSKSDTKLSGITNFVKTKIGNSRQFLKVLGYIQN
ncbi:KilA-N domain-containing protein [Acinetobacter guillouiae]|uniref:KilA-N domain-containing protein n=1 Tax=Acinetobacter guillouiae TaxID=106649 RepID=UPI0021CF1E82|nr:KilA-N domain-containing protein [Acinetobacter guillouiae]